MLNITLPIQGHFALFSLLFVKFEKFLSDYSYLVGGVTLALLNDPSLQAL